ncbi:hypothetical protein HanRHA438_Chr05g0230611 [Helianthus annuus]|nr:hypothetical protein HanIR_Chr05g0238461 [Helianthus annuus]KAJ0919518.1 hypothetical protein HanRHA438_Chr05g0230611 [Helianthus annuus]
MHIIAKLLSCKPRDPVFFSDIVYTLSVYSFNLHIKKIKMYKSYIVVSHSPASKNKKERR